MRLEMLPKISVDVHSLEEAVKLLELYCFITAHACSCDAIAVKGGAALDNCVC